jgi:type IX secretion system PorP/SprF family membrane protein
MAGMNVFGKKQIIYFYLSTLALVCLTSNGLLAQDVHLSQYYAAPAYLNPAMIGARSAPNVHLNYRSQRLTYDVPLDVGQLSFVMPLVAKGGRRAMQIGSAGLSVFNMTSGPQGSYKVQGLHLTAAYNVMIDRQGTQMLSFGLQGGMIQKTINLSSFRWGTQYDPFIGYNELITPSYSLITEQTYFPEFNAGMMWHYGLTTRKGGRKSKTRMFAGFSANNLNRPDQSLVNEQPRPASMLFRLHGGGEFSISRQLRLMPNMLVKMREGVYSINVGSYLSYDIGNNYRQRNADISLMVGSWYRLQDSFIFTMGASGKRYALGISYDMNVSNLQYNFNGPGAMEISLSYNIGKSKGTPRRFSTPLI